MNADIHPKQTMLDLTPAENLVLIALWSWLNHHPAGTFQEFCNAYQRAREVTNAA